MKTTCYVYYYFYSPYGVALLAQQPVGDQPMEVRYVREV
jgi:hypothetical protein